MEENKVTFLKEKKIQQEARKNLDFIMDRNSQNPIKSKFLAFQKTKKNITPKDLF